MYSNSKGFSLIELSIVVVLIGFIVASVVGGKNLIDQAKLRQQMSELQNYETGINAFRLEYDTIPGDLRRASSYWGTATNGDGNKRITTSVDDNYLVANEGLKFFHHLALAEIIKAPFDGTYVFGVGYPPLKIDPSKGMMAGGAISTATHASYQLSNSNITTPTKLAIYLNVSSPGTTSTAYDDGNGTLTPQQAQTIDNKIDDGAARSGKFQAYTPRGTTVGNCLSGSEGDYLLSVITTACVGKYIIIE